MAFCHDLLVEAPVGNIGLFSFVFAAIQFLTIVLIVFWLHRQSRLARKGDSVAAARLVLPYYMWILYAFAIVDAFEAAVNIALPIEIDGTNSIATSAFYGAGWGLYHVVLDGTTFFLLQHSGGINAVKRATLLGLLWGAITTFCHGATYYFGESWEGLAFEMGWEGVMLLFYAALIVAPMSWVFRRPAVTFYAWFWCSERSLYCVAYLLQYFGFDAGDCVYMFTIWVVFGLVKPYVVYKTLLHDSEYWQGLYYTSIDEGDSVSLGARSLGKRSGKVDFESFASSKSTSGGIFRAFFKSQGSGSVDSISSQNQQQHAETSEVAREAFAPGSGVEPTETSSLLAGGAASHVRSYSSAAEVVTISAAAAGQSNSAPIAVAARKSLAKEGPHSPLHFGAKHHRSSITQPLMGTSISSSSARELAARMDDLEQGVKLINYAYLAMDPNNYIGTGGLSKVFRGELRGKPVAVKMVFCVDLTPEIISNFCRESSLLSGLNHPNIVKVEGVCIVPPSICLVMELCQGALFERLRDPMLPPLDWPAKLRIATDCANGVAYLHQQNVLHMDLKSSNFLIGLDGIAKVSDLELSRRVQNLDKKALKQQKKRLKLKTSPVVDHRYTEDEDALEEPFLSVEDVQVPETVNWSAPEVIAKGIFTNKSDVYSLGMVLYEILTGLVPFDDPLLKKSSNSISRSSSVSVNISGLAGSPAGASISPSASLSALAYTSQASSSYQAGKSLSVMAGSSSAVVVDAVEYSTSPSDSLLHHQQQQRPTWYSRINNNSQHLAVLICEKGLRPTIPPDCPRDFADLLSDAWDHDPAVRPSAAQVAHRLQLMLEDAAAKSPTLIR